MTAHFLQKIVEHHLEVIYQGVVTKTPIQQLATTLLQTMRIAHVGQRAPQHINLWSEKDTILITYGDSVLADDESPLKTLLNFTQKYTSDLFNTVHILPFMPYSSDDGFSVIDYSTVNEALGNWEHIEAIGDDTKLMADLVINHCSSRSVWFQNFSKADGPGHDFFYTADPNGNYAMVVRPRTSPLLKSVETAEGTKHVWCTFSHDQIDLDFRNSEVLVTFAEIIRLYLDKGVRILRLDAIAFLWKELDSNCINLPQTHEVVRLIRTLVEHACPNAIIITETNIPNRENISYFGNANEAHWVYNFSLPPLLVHSLLSGTSQYLKQWMMTMPPAQNGTAYFNFIASHDGIGMRPLEGLVPDEEIEKLKQTVHQFGGKVSYRMLPDGTQKAYELNIALIDMLKGTFEGQDHMGFERFICAHTIMLGLEGIPALYIHSLLGTQNDHARVENTGRKRSINRKRWALSELAPLLEDSTTSHAKVYNQLATLLKIRKKQKAFHPNAFQFTLQLGEQFVGFWRQSIDRQQSIFCVSNIQNRPHQLSLTDINLICTDSWYDLIGTKELDVESGELILEPYQTLWISNRKYE